MITGLEKLKARRAWFVPGFNVWGSPSWGEIDLIMVENVGAVKSVLFDPINIGDSAQEVPYGDLTDFRGNALPATIKNPRVLIRAKSEYAAFIVGDESDQVFRVARDASITGPVKVDLFIVEMGD